MRGRGPATTDTYVQLVEETCNRVTAPPLTGAPTRFAELVDACITVAAAAVDVIVVLLAGDEADELTGDALQADVLHRLETQLEQLINDDGEQV